MDMATTAASISDEWEHVADDDNYSVHSLPDSDVDALDALQAVLSAATLSSPPDNATQTSDTPPCENPPRSEQSIEPDGNQAVERCGMDTRDVIAPDPPDAPATPANQDPPPAKPRKIHLTHLAHLAHLPEFDPITAYDHFEQVSGLVTLSQVLLDLPIDNRTKSSLQAIYLHLVRLEDILTEYAKHRNSSGGHPPFPRGFDSWVEALRYHLTVPPRSSTHKATTRRSQHLETKQGTPKSPPRPQKSHAEIANCSYEQFLSLLGQMDEYMMVIESDLVDFRALYSSTLLLENNSLSTIYSETLYDEWSRPSKAAASKNTNKARVRLRKELHRLRRQIEVCLSEILSCRCQEFGNDRDQWERLVVLHDSYRNIKDDMDYMLDWPNHMFEQWLDRNASSPNLDTIRSMIIELKEVTEALFLERKKKSCAHRGNDPDTVPRSPEEKLIYSNVVMETLEGLERLIISVLHLEGRDVSSYIDGEFYL
ncbi:hypothetical protein F4678DRAFT_420329 [Xylaria arbuscula]|nr:hypothetical protein F4678DRAFT_420329 [Xylaria arbuscula]